MAMPPGAGPAMIRAAAVIPVVLIVLFTGLLWLLGLMCGRDRRRYVTCLSRQAMATIGVLLHGSSVLPPSTTPGTAQLDRITLTGPPPQVARDSQSDRTAPTRASRVT